MQAYEIMIRQVYKVKESDKVRSVIEKFIEHSISGLERDGVLVGIISRGDVIRHSIKTIL